MERDDILTAFLLGDLPEDEREKIEEKFFSDEAFADHILALESALVDRYVRGEVARDERTKIEQRMLSGPRGRRALEFAQQLAAEARPRFGFWRRLFLAPSFAYGLAGVAAAAVIVTAVNARFEVNQMRSQINGLESTNQSQARRNRDLTSALQSRAQTSGGVASILLNAESVRSAASVPAVTLNGDEQFVVIRIDLGADSGYPSYRLELQSASGEHVGAWDSVHALASNAGMLEVPVEASSLTASKFEAHLQGRSKDGSLQDLSYSYFSVTRK